MIESFICSACVNKRKEKIQYRFHAVFPIGLRAFLSYSFPVTSEYSSRFLSFICGKEDVDVVLHVHPLTDFKCFQYRPAIAKFDVNILVFATISLQTERWMDGQDQVDPELDIDQDSIYRLEGLLPSGCVLQLF